MRIAYFSCQMPYPATHGGLVDDWARLNAFKHAGADLMLITWFSDSKEGVTAAQNQALASVASTFVCLPIGRHFIERIRRLCGLIRYPSHVASRIPSLSARSKIWNQMDAFEPEAIWLDSIYPSVLALEAAARYNVPLFYRSHNIEHQYMRAQVNRVNNVRDKLAWSLNLPHLRKIEFNAWKKASEVFDISLGDLDWWHSQGMNNGHWLPPLVSPEKVMALSSIENYLPAYDVGYLGNLRTPNNVEGIFWFLRQVWPLVLKVQPCATFLLAGSSPVPEIVQLANSTKNVKLLPSPEDVIPVLRDCRVLINAVFAGSGVNVKSVDMLFTPCHLVSTSQGVTGLPQSVKDCFSVNDKPEDFANAVLNFLQNKFGEGLDYSSRQFARRQFSYEKIQDVMLLMKKYTESAC